MKEINVPLLYLLSFVVYWRFLFSRSVSIAGSSTMRAVGHGCTGIFLQMGNKAVKEFHSCVLLENKKLRSARFPDIVFFGISRCCTNCFFREERFVFLFFVFLQCPQRGSLYLQLNNVVITIIYRGIRVFYWVYIV